MLSARRGGGWREDGITIIVKFYERKESSEILSSMTCSIALRNNFKCRVCDESFHQALEMEEEEAEDRQPEMETKFSPVLSFGKQNYSSLTSTCHRHQLYCDFTRRQNEESVENVAWLKSHSLVTTKHEKLIDSRFPRNTSSSIKSGNF